MSHLMGVLCRLALVLVLACAGASAAQPIWQQSNGDVYGTFSAPVGWKTISNVSEYSLFWTQQRPTNALSGVVDSRGVLYAEISCNSNECQDFAPPQPFGWDKEIGPFGGIAAVAPNGTLLWWQFPGSGIGNAFGIALIEDESIVSVVNRGQIGNSLVTMMRASDGALYQINNSPFVNLATEAAYLWDDARSRFYTYGLTNSGPKMVAVSWSSCGPLCLTFSQVWTSFAFPSAEVSDVALSRPVLTTDASHDILAFDNANCNLYRVHAADGSKVSGPLNFGGFSQDGAKNCGMHLGVNPATSQAVASGYVGDNHFIAAMYTNGAAGWHHVYSGSWYVNAFAIGPEAVYAILIPVGGVFDNPSPAIVLNKYSHDGTQVYSVMHNITGFADPRSITVLGDYIGVMPGSNSYEYNSLMLLDEATGEIALNLPMKFAVGGGSGPRDYDPIIPGLNGQLYSAVHWSAFTANCIPEDLQQSYHEVCSFGGVCHEGACECLPGFLPPSCAECLPGHFGEGCSPCQCLGNSTCLGSGSRAGNGTCVCGSGFHGPDCATCNPGFTGPLCDEQCPVGPHGTTCSGNGHCNQTVYGDGSCTCIQGFAPPSCSSCAEGYGGPGCSECLPGFAGSPCLPCPGSTIVNGTVTQVCTGHGVCENSGTTTSGVCKCSDDRFTGPGCSKCAVGFWGPNCSPCPRANGEICNEEGTCNGSGTQGGTGVCECTAGFTGPACDQCKPDHYGGFCQACPGLTSGDVCSGHGTCNQGINGDGSCDCSLLYSGNECSSCKHNRIYPNCTSCPPNAWGPTCSLCPSPGKYVCNKHGTCNGAGTIGGTGACKCDKGWGGDDCTSCGAGFWGYPDCQACPGEASGAVCGGHGQCSPSTGVCSCATGFTGNNCEECKSTYFGPSCQACPGSSGDSVCSGHGSCDSGVRGNGTCSCTHPYSGSACSECASCKPSSNTWTYAIVGGAGGIVVLLGGVFWLAQRRKKQRRSSGSARPLLDSTAEATDPELAKKQHDQA